MSIENNLKRIADALEKQNELTETLIEIRREENQSIVDSVMNNREEITGDGVEVEVPDSVIPEPPEEEKPKATKKKRSKKVAPPPVEETKTSGLTVEIVNEELKKHYVRLGNDMQVITEVMKSKPFNAVSIRDIPEDKWQALIDAVAAIPTPGSV